MTLVVTRSKFCSYELSPSFVGEQAPLRVELACFQDTSGRRLTASQVAPRIAKIKPFSKVDDTSVASQSLPDEGH